MIEKVIYINHLNESFSLGENGIFINENDLHDYMWAYNTESNKISYFERGIVSKTLPIVVANPNGYSIINDLMEICEKDVLAKQYGRLIIGGYYLNCYILGSKKKNYSLRRGYLNAELSLITDSSQWIKETTKTFSDDGSGAVGGKNLDFPFDFPYDFASPTSVKNLINPSFADTDFKLIVYGEVTNPSIYINGHLYEVNCYVAANEYLTINSKEKTITITRNNGEVINHFKDRNKESYIFEKISSGENSISWIGDITFEITLYEERSEPKWI